MTPRIDSDLKAQWLRKLDRATKAHEKTRLALDELVTDARAAGVPLTNIADHTPYSREWARQIADRIDAERAKPTAAEPAQPDA